MSRAPHARVLAAVVCALLPGSPAFAAAGELTDCRLDAGPRFATAPARCATIEVPENPAAPDGATIPLAVAVVASLNVEPEPDPLVLLAGGPGQAATEFYLAYAAAFERIRLERDIVLIDQRGTGRSNALDCDETIGLMDAPGDRSALAGAVAECLESLPGDPRYYTTSIAVGDLEHARRALGYGEINLYGISYGTRVAQHYLRRYPARTRSLILDGVVPPQLVLGPAIALDAQAALEAMFRRCAADRACNTRFPELATAFEALYRRLRENPVDVEVAAPASGARTTRRLSELELAGAVRLLSYSATTVAILPLIIDSAWRDRHYEPLAAQVIAAEASLGEMLSTGMHNSVVCSEDAPFFERAGIAAETLASTYLGTELVDTMTALCELWPAGAVDADFHEPVASDVPVLLLSGEYDPVTPPAYAEQAAERLTNNLHLVGPSQGHGLAPLGCVPRIMAEFVASASVDGLGTVCVGKLAPLPFFVDFSGPRQ